MAPVVTPTTINMTILTTMTSLSQSIYESSPVNFINDTEAYTTIDIDQSKLIRLSWCSLYPLTVNTVT
jgi:hypothetical protein